MKVRDVLGVHGVVLEVSDPAAEAWRWRLALGLPVLRRNRRETVLGSVAFFVILRRTAGPERVAEVHVAVEGLEGAGRRHDRLGGRHVEAGVAGARLIVREPMDPPSREWLPRRRRSRRATRR